MSLQFLVRMLWLPKEVEPYVLISEVMDVETEVEPSVPVFGCCGHRDGG